MIRNGASHLRIGVDLMGGENSPLVLFQAVQKAIEEFPQIDFVLFLTQSAFDEIALSADRLSKRASLDFQIVSDVIEMQDDPLIAIRQKKNSSLVAGIKFLKKRSIHAFVSLGNTGAFIAGAKFFLTLLKGIQRPALLATLPTKKGTVAIIDVGGNVMCKASHHLQFARLGIAYQSCQGIKNPRIGLLNIGVESKKGTEEIRLAYHLLSEIAHKDQIHFIGNVEGRDVFQGDVDVLITDGFTGNVLLKTSEGVSSFILQQVDQILSEVVPNHRLSILKRLQEQFDDEEYSGAIICGIDAVAVKCHGQTSPKGLFRGISRAIELVQADFIQQMKIHLSSE